MTLSRQILFCNKEQVINYREKIEKITNEKMKELWQSGDGIDFLKQVKFNKCGYDPLFEEPTNFIEQVNQVCTYLVCLSAVELLLAKYPDHQFVVNFGVESGYDVESVDKSVIAECFAVTSPDSNDKLLLDTGKVHANQIARDKYIIYYASNPKPIHVSNIRKKYQGVEIIALDSF